MKIKVYFDQTDIEQLFAERYNVDISETNVEVVYNANNGVWEPSVVITTDHFIEDRGY